MRYSKYGSLGIKQTFSSSLMEMSSEERVSIRKLEGNK